jgi:hypothetical protein
LLSFLEANLDQFEQTIAEEIRELARGVTKASDGAEEEGA